MATKLNLITFGLSNNDEVLFSPFIRSTTQQRRQNYHFIAIAPNKRDKTYVL